MARFLARRRVYSRARAPARSGNARPNGDETAALVVRRPAARRTRTGPDGLRYGSFMAESADRAAVAPSDADGPSPPFPAPEREGWRPCWKLELRRHVVDVWFPRCVDNDRGGF